MSPARKVVRIRRSSPEPLLETQDVDDMLDAFGIDDAVLERVDVTIPDGDDARPERPVRKISGVMAKVTVPCPPPADADIVAQTEDEIEELTDGIVDGWEEEPA